MAVDVCVVSLHPLSTSQVNNIENALPLGRLIWSSCSPLGIARYKAIQAVTSEWFAFVDDDVRLGAGWFDVVKRFMGNDVGAVSSYDNNLGMKVSELYYQGFCSATLVRRNVVAGWFPKYPQFVVEDFDLLSFVRSRGYRWLSVPAPLWHYHSLVKGFVNARWQGVNYRWAFPDRRLLKRVLRFYGGCIKSLLRLDLRVFVDCVGWIVGLSGFGCGRYESID